MFLSAGLYEGYVTFVPASSSQALSYIDLLLINLSIEMSDILSAPNVNSTITTQACYFLFLVLYFTVVTLSEGSGLSLERLGLSCRADYFCSPFLPR